MAAAAGSILPRLSQIQVWDTEHLVTAAGWWDATATRWQDGFSEVVRQSYTPGGIWEGAAAGAAQERALADRTKVDDVARRLRATSADARAGAAELVAARRRVLVAVKAALAAGFEVGDDLTVSYDDDGTPAMAARRAQAESMARDIWQGAGELAAADRRVAERITKSSNGIQSLDFGPDRGGPRLTPADGRGPHNSDDVFGIVDPLPPGKQPHVRELPTSDQIRALYDWLTQNGVLAPPSNYPGAERVLDDGTRIGIREDSRSGGTTVDINFGDERDSMKVHLSDKGEEPQTAPASGNPGFWHTVGGIGVAILGGIAWVGEHAVHPLN